MIESVEFRVADGFAGRLFAEDEGVRLGSIRRVRIRTTDSRFAEVGQLQQMCLDRHGRPFFFGWRYLRRYSEPELEAAELFSVQWLATFEPAGEECGTVIDEAEACARCGAGAVQRGPLVLPVRRIPKTRDFAITIAGERVVSERARRGLSNLGVTGAEFRAVQSTGGGLTHWHQLLAVGPTVQLAPSTEVGNGPFDLDPGNENRCPLGHVAGLNLLSEVTIVRPPGPLADLVETTQYVGVRRGLLRPERLLLVSPRVRRLVLDEGLKGWGFEVAHIVNE